MTLDRFPHERLAVIAGPVFANVALPSAVNALVRWRILEGPRRYGFGFCGGAATTRLFLALEPRISIYVGSNALLTSLTRGWVGFLHSIFEPSEPQSENACSSLFRLFGGQWRTITN